MYLQKEVLNVNSHLRAMPNMDYNLLFAKQTCLLSGLKTLEQYASPCICGISNKSILKCLNIFPFQTRFFPILICICIFYLTHNKNNCMNKRKTYPFPVMN